jgi:hypothetical protein
VPANRIGAGAHTITPEMLPLVALAQEQIDAVRARVRARRQRAGHLPAGAVAGGHPLHHLMSGEGDPYLLTTRSASGSGSGWSVPGGAAGGDRPARHPAHGRALGGAGPEPVQVVWRNAPLMVEDVELTRATEMCGAAVRRFDPRHHRIDVRTAPLLRAHVAHDPVGSMVAAPAAHTLAGDHTTMELLRDEISAHLNGTEAGCPAAALPQLRAQARLGSRARSTRRSSGDAGDVDEPTRPSACWTCGATARDREADEVVERALGERLRKQARRLGVSVASCSTWRTRRCWRGPPGREDVVFGTVLFGPCRAARARTGWWARSSHAPHPPAVWQGGGGGVRQAHASLTELLRHEHASLALAQRSSGVQAPLPLFSALLNYRHSPAGDPAEYEARVAANPGMERLRVEERSNYPLTLSVDDRGAAGWP